MILHHFSPSRKLFQDVRDNYGSCVYNKKLVFIALGCVILGMGMTLSGAVSIYIHLYYTEKMFCPVYMHIHGHKF